MSGVVSINKFKIENFQKILDHVSGVVKENSDVDLVFVGYAGETTCGVFFTADTIGEHLRIMGLGHRLSAYANERMCNLADDDGFDI